ncbi:MAG: phosphatidylglycerophosphatase A [Elusimicrobia bacterium]|nr:phosphatidylglycerophosphatase A [Elusimicrobiota bacterium]
MIERIAGLRSRICVAFATGFYLSYIPVTFFETVGRPRSTPANWKGAGFVGTLEGWAMLYLLPTQPVQYAATVAAAILAACWVSGEAERGLGTKDDPRIIIDEIVGYWVTVAFLPRKAAVLALGFLLFRFFDSVKLPPYRWLERLPGGFGVVMDDVGAGIAANLVLRVLYPSA